MREFEESILRDRARLADSRRRASIRIAVLGPAESNDPANKRNQIRDALDTRGHEVFFPEQLANNESDVSLLDQELQMLSRRDVDWIVVLETTAGPLAEVSAFVSVPAIRSKTFLLIPEEYYAPGSTFPTDIAEQYSSRWRFSNEELEQCLVVREVWTRARNIVQDRLGELGSTEV